MGEGRAALDCTKIPMVSPYPEPSLDQACQDSARDWPKRYFQDVTPKVLEGSTGSIALAPDVKLLASTGEDMGNLLLRVVLWMAAAKTGPTGEPLESPIETPDFVAPHGTKLEWVHGVPSLDVRILGDSNTTSYEM